jgi:hypothetical protein
MFSIMMLEQVGSGSGIISFISSWSTVVTHCNELQVNKVNRIEVEVVIHCNELQVNKVNRTEVEVVTHCNELQELPPLQFYRPYSLVVHHSE